ncbi:carboxylating nicotinate-nucleotide diphosphorylase [Pelosinus fermentans]|uniref:Probable nicotinate-nucleotide pyrophosphorylase [carboxylating] n=1 Tax=Pelosinus fermentans JBW45 TaxID=1192197 RepID=I9NP40_9FIRM|nr:carboxylating nicotinate-nucleotide diphosphorylase [Pelosinus fermentans]AJQ28514.1 nicotinate-nucleotide pyrophosphorylase [Pelosinus fermentans JBW45]
MNKLALDDLLRRSLLEDIGFGDITSEAIFPEDHISQGFLLAKQNLVLAGMQVFTQVFALLDSQIQINPYYADGTAVPAGEKIASMAGNTRSLLAGERVALNLLQRMSGIATHTRRYVEAVNDFPAVIVDTRKTTPGLRMLEKYAVTVGGGKNHRYGLDSMVLIKDNHIQAAGGISTAVQRVRSQGAFFRKIEVEVENLQQVQEALSVGVDIIMLDNMHIQMIEQAVKMIDGKALVEVSGNVVLERVSELAAAGVDIISSGELTHSVKAADISMRLS